ncbi:MAG TPA: hypothetical protein VGE37_14535 [Archangium sp.]
MSLPVPGEVFAFAVKPKVVLQLRCVAATKGAACIVLTRAKGKSFEVLPLDHHEWKRPMLGGWVSEPSPLKSLGVQKLEGDDLVIHPSAWVKVAKKTKALAAKVLPKMTWDALLDEVRTQWRWENERKAVEREDAAREAEVEQSFEQALIESHNAQLKLLNSGVEGLIGKKFFEVWKGERPKSAIVAAERVMSDALKDLAGKTPKQAAKRLAVAMKQFSALHEAIEFDEDAADDVLDALLVVANVCEVGAEAFEKIVDVERTF